MKEHKSEIVLKPCLGIKDIAYWQKRARELLPEHNVTCLVANND